MKSDLKEFSSLSTSLRDLAIKIEYSTQLNNIPQYENVKLIRKMIHSNFKPEEGHHSYDVVSFFTSVLFLI